MTDIPDMRSIQEREAIKDEFRGISKDTLLLEVATLTMDLKKTNHQLETAKRIIKGKEDLSGLHSNVRILGERLTNFETQMQRMEAQNKQIQAQNNQIQAQNNQILAILMQQQQNVPVQGNIKMEPKVEPLWYNQPFDGNNSIYDSYKSYNPNENGHC